MFTLFSTAVFRLLCLAIQGNNRNILIQLDFKEFVLQETLCHAATGHLSFIKRGSSLEETNEGGSAALWLATVVTQKREKVIIFLVSCCSKLVET